eukprot:1191202-Alexandrium_andersonii.AAC.1
MGKDRKRGERLMAAVGACPRLCGRGQSRFEPAHQLVKFIWFRCARTLSRLAGSPKQGGFGAPPPM